MPVIVEGRGMVLGLVRGDHRLNEIKLGNALGADVPPGDRARRSRPSSGRPASSARSARRCPVIKDAAIQGVGLLRRRQPPRRAPDRGRARAATSSFEELDIRTVEAGDLSPGGDPIEIETAIEVGNIFKLGTRYSEPLGATYLDPDGKERPIVMGSYGIGPARIVAAAIEQNADEKGIVWPRALAPWQVHLVALGKAGRGDVEAAERLYEELARGRARGRSTTTARPGRGRS